MDYVSPDFPFLDHSSDDLFKIVCQQNTTQQDDDLLGNIWAVLEDESNANLNRKRSDNGRASPAGDGSHNNQSKKRKMIHRDLERQRRQEMATLYASLRAMLPHDYLKGKRSISDHMNEAVKYIKHLQSKIEKLTKERQELQRCCNLEQPAKQRPSQEYYAEVEEVIVRPCLVGVELVVTTSLKQALPPSSVLQLVASEGFIVVSCVSTKVNERFVHTILSEVSCWRSIDLLALKQKLKKLRTPVCN